MPGYSKAPRGLFVQVEIGRVFTAIAISPSKGSRQLLTRDAIRAGRNLPDKELRYRRTVIVTAAVYRSFISKQYIQYLRMNVPPIHLTYRHWAGVSPYTSLFSFARTCVFDKQSISNRLLQPHRVRRDKAGHLPKLRPVWLPSSLSLFLSLALVFSTNPPVSVCGTACFNTHCEPFLAG